MGCRHTRLLHADAAGIQAAADILRAGGLVALPTETVYGLGAHALDAAAVRGIFEAKGRPADDPVIVHLQDAAQLGTVAFSNELASRLADAFWPGPLTLVLPKREVVPSEVTAGLDTVAVRVPSHTVARAILEAARVPVAAPSANLFSRPSPTTAQHVLDDLRGRIDAVVDGGPTQVGVESTIVDVVASPPRLLRPGGVPSEAIEAILGTRLKVPERGPIVAPGMLPVHYSPRTPLTLFVGPGARANLLRAVVDALEAGKRVGILALEEDTGLLPDGVCTEVVGAWNGTAGSAKRLFEAIRALDAEKLDLLLARELADPAVGLGRALEDRLRRAAQTIVD